MAFLPFDSAASMGRFTDLCESSRLTPFSFTCFDVVAGVDDELATEAEDDAVEVVALFLLLFSDF